MPKEIVVAKCCEGLNEAFVESSATCEENSETAFADALNSHNAQFANDYRVFSDRLSPEDCFGAGVMPLTDSRDFRVNADGRLAFKDRLLSAESPQEYCLERFIGADNASRLAAVVCEAEDDKCEFKFSLYPALMSLSCVALLLTISVYALVPQLRNVPGKIVMSLSLSLFAAFFILIVENVVEATNLPYAVCVALAVFMQYFFLAAFTWMFLMSFDIFLTFRSIRSRAQNGESRFLYFGLIGWIFPLLLSISTLTLDLSLNKENHLRPNFGNGTCWFNGDWQAGIYFYLPISVVLSVNAALFLTTIRGLWSEHRPLSTTTAPNGTKRVVLRQHSKNTKQKLDSVKMRMLLNAKLFVLMGLTWAFEIVSWCTGSKLCWIWLLTDACNMLQGVGICAIFVCKRSVWKKLVHRIRQLY